MEILATLAIFLLTCAFSMQTSHPSYLDLDLGSFWKMNGSDLLGENHFEASLQFLEVNGTENVKNSDLQPAPKEDCFSSEESKHMEDCQSFLEESFDANRLPQVMSTVRCLQTTADVSSKKTRYRRAKCEEVLLDLPVLRKSSDGEGQRNYAVTFEPTSVACVRTVRPSRIISKTALRIY